VGARRTIELEHEFNINAVVEPDPTDEMFKTFYFDYPSAEVK
jgi:hypothetical protein